MTRSRLVYPLIALLFILVMVAGAIGWLPSLLVAIAIYGVPAYLTADLVLHGLPTGRVERTVIAVAMSVTLLIIAAQVLNLLPSGITPTSWIVLLGALGLVAAAALARRGAPRRPQLPAAPWRSIRTVDAVRLAGAALLGVLAVLIAVQNAEVRTDDGFTQLWIDRSADSARISVQSHELEAGTYRLVVSTEQEDHDFSLAPGESWFLSVQIPDGASEIDVRLYRADDEEPYRQVDVKL
jgi:hypothetical protein